MAHILGNEHRGRGLPGLAGDLNGIELIGDPAGAKALYARCPKADVTPLIAIDTLARELGIASLDAKDERGRMGLGNFKALGAAHAIAKRAAALAGPDDDLSQALAGETFACASAGNHGLSVAVGARAFGARAVIYLSETVPAVFADLLRAKGADVVIEGADYEASMAAAMAAAEREGWQLLSDSSWPGYLTPARDVMEGYLVMAAEAAEQIAAAPSHIFLQAGVGGLAASCAVMARRVWGDGPRICVVEPEFAPALQSSIAAGAVVNAAGPVSAMGRLDCKVPSLLALDVLAREADVFMTVSEDEAAAGVAVAGRHGIASSPSGAAGLVGLIAACRAAGDDGGLEITDKARALVYVSEGEVDV